MSEVKSLWADGPFELISASKAGYEPGVELTGAKAMTKEMVTVHNVLIRGVNAIHRQALRVSSEGTAQDKLDFTNFSIQWCRTVHQHHELEEKDLFPRMAQEAGEPGLMDVAQAEHKEFEDGLKRLEEWLVEVREGREEFEGEKLVGILDEVVPLVHGHLSREIGMLMGLKRLDDKVEWKKVFDEVVQASSGAEMKQSYYRTDLMPMVLHLHDKSFEDGAFADFPPFPWIVLQGIKWLFCGTRASWWRFAPCDANSQRRELLFA